LCVSTTLSSPSLCIVVMSLLVSAFANFCEKVPSKSLLDHCVSQLLCRLLVCSCVPMCAVGRYHAWRTYVGLARTIHIRCVYGIFGREVTIYTVIYGVYIRFWPTLNICYLPSLPLNLQCLPPTACIASLARAFCLLILWHLMSRHLLESFPAGPRYNARPPHGVQQLLAFS
jgi:hypothetical protein